MIRTTIDHVDEPLLSLIDAAFRGEDVFITLEDEQGERTLKLIAIKPAPDHGQDRPEFGSARGLIHVKDNFDDPIDDFRDFE